MGIYIPNIEPPKQCRSCIALLNGSCRLVQDPYPDDPKYTHPREIFVYEGQHEDTYKPDWCPLREAKDYPDALESVTSYNGLDRTVFKWLFLEFDEYSLLCPHNYCLDYKSESDYAQLQVLWMIAVELFGDYGTSPRFGWIETAHKEEFHKWILDLTKGYRADDEYDGPIEYMEEYDIWTFDENGKEYHTINVEERRKRERGLKCDET